MAAGRYDFTLEKGATLSLPVVWKDGDGDAVDLTGYSARAQFRTSVESDEKVLDLTSADSGGITIDAANGKVTLTASATQTAAITATRLVYDLELEDASGTVTRLLEGKANVSPEVTR